MSLINQMLRDLEQRRTADITSSPLGGISASASAIQPVGVSINYVALAAMVAVVFTGGVIVAYLLGSQQQMIATENTLTTIPEKETSVFIANTVPKNTKINMLPTTVQSVKNPITETVVKTDSVMMVKEKMIKTVIKEPVAEKVISMTARPVIENIIEQTSANNEQNINKTIRPLTDEQQSQLVFQRAIHLLSRDNRQEAQLALEEALSFSPVHFRARETLAALLLNAGRMSEAASTLREGLQLLPDATPLAKLYARILVDQNNIVTAIAVLERARPAVAADPEYYALLAALYQKAEKHAQAAQLYQQILLQRPGVASWWMGLALAQDAMGKNATALDAFQRAQRAGGLSDKVLKYVQTRIAALTPAAPVPVDAYHALDEFEE